jgi:hypothetical protein
VQTIRSILENRVSPANLTKGIRNMKIPSPLICRLSQQTAFGRFALPILAVVLLGIAVQSAYAHHPVVSGATPFCGPNGPEITYTVSAWVINGPGMESENSNVEVLFNGAQVGSGAFVDPTDSFTGTADAPAGVTSVVVSALAVATWGDGFPGGENSSDDNASITVDLSSLDCAPPGNGRFTGGGKVVVGDATVPPGPVTVTKGFEVECDLNPAHENLELNWGPGNHFHMDKITSAVCTLSGIAPNPPTAPVNRIDATGIGSYNGVEGYTVVFTLWDHGEPGVNDEAGFTVCQTDPANPKSCSTSPNIVLSVSLQPVTTGNVQAHVDQH